MKILIFAPENSIHTIKWIEYFEERNHEVLLVSFDSHRDPAFMGHKKARTQYLKLPFPSKLAYYFTFLQLRRILKAFQPDLFHAHYVSSYGVTGALAGFQPYVISVWGTDIYEAPNQSRILNRLIRFAFSKCNVVCSTSLAMKGETEKYTDKPIHFIPFGVDTTSFVPKHRPSKETFTFGIVKTMDRVYGIDYLIKAYGDLKERITKEQFLHTRLVIVGEGPLMTEYQELVKSLGLEKQVEFRGKIPHEEVVNVLSEFDVFIMPSVWESFGVAALEAQACGVPVIVTNVGGVPEIVEDGKTGFVVPPCNDKLLADKMTQLLQSPALRETFSANARQFVCEKYDWKKNAKKLEDLYYDLIIK